MADQRRSQRGKGPKGGRGPGRVAGARTPRGVRDTGEHPQEGPTTDSPAKRRLRPRLTGRAAILVLVLAVLVVSYASSFKAYLQQRHDIDALTSQIEQRQQSIADLEAQKKRWQDPAYVEQQARAQFGYVMPGEVAYVALDAHGHRIQPQAELGNPARVGTPGKPTAWWTNAWGSVELAGNPPRQDTSGPSTQIGRTHKQKE